MSKRASIFIVLIALTFGPTILVAAARAEEPSTTTASEAPEVPSAVADAPETAEPGAGLRGDCPRRECCRGPRGPGSSGDTSEDGRQSCCCCCGGVDRATESRRGGCARHGRQGRERGDGWRANDGRGPRGEELGSGAGPGGGRGGKRAEMEVYRTLLANHDKIERTVEEIPGGVRTTTTTGDPELVPEIRRHVSQMKALVEGGGHIRIWDPLFVEIFRHADKIEMMVEEVDGGAVVTETSADEDVAKLIRAHAAKVDQFIARGNEAYGEATPLPEGYPSTR